MFVVKIFIVTTHVMIYILNIVIDILVLHISNIYYTEIIYLQERYSKQRDKMLEAYFTCSIFIFISLYIIQLITIPQ